MGWSLGTPNEVDGGLPSGYAGAGVGVGDGEQATSCLLCRGGCVSFSCDSSSMINEYEKLLAGLDDVDWASLSHA